MNELKLQLVAELHGVVADLGSDGGRISPSVYDTAQVLRFAPPRDRQPALTWLLAQQADDGGWADPRVPLARHASTLATLLALQTFSLNAQQRNAVTAGYRWVDAHHEDWFEPLTEGLPVGVELILPRLLLDAYSPNHRSLPTPYAELIALGQRRRRQFTQRPICAGTRTTHTWEAWGSRADPLLIDMTGGVGHSPAATAAWLQAAHSKNELQDACRAAERYLHWASRATELDIPGVVPTVFPIARFEQAFGLYILVLADLLEHPLLQPILEQQIADLAGAIGTIGLGFSDHFEPDGDDTAAALAVTRSAGRLIELAPLYRFTTSDHFCAYQNELQASPSVVAHALHALTLYGETNPPAMEYLLAAQDVDGRWVNDKWNRSWLYSTSHVLMALHSYDVSALAVRAVGADAAMPHQRDTNHRLSAAAQRAVDAIVTAQRPCGGWGDQRVSTEETAYAVLALQALKRQDGLDDAAADHLLRGEAWLVHQYTPRRVNPDQLWLGKETFRPYRLARMIELAATLRSLESLETISAEGALPV